MKILIVREIKIFFLLFFSYINKNLSCDCCDECWEKFFPDKKTSSKYSDKNKKLDIPSIIEDGKEEGENQGEKEEGNEEENKEENEEENEEERIKREEEERKKKEEEEERKKKEEEEDKKEEEERKEYLESLLEDITKVRILKDDFFTEKKHIYERGRELGKGGFGCVCKIKKNNGNFFALKQIVVKKPDIVKIFQKEIQNMILLRNEKNIVKIFDVYRQDNFVGNFLKKIYSKKDNAVCFYIIMEFCENGDLHDFINKEISDKENLRDKIACQIINAVNSCHKEKIAHRDLKPQNIFLDKDWNVKLGDFGLSDKFEYDGKDGSIVGSLRYMCYEKIQRKEHNPFKADLYSLGVILYELYTELLYCDVELKFTYKNGKKVINGDIDKFYKNENVEDKLNKNLADENFKNLKILLTGLLQQLGEDRCGWNEILKSEFYKELNEKYKNK